LATVVEVAAEIQAPAIWGETTKGSAAFYKKTLDLRHETAQFPFWPRFHRGQL